MSKSGVRNVSHIVIHAKNIKKSISFYELLGFSVDRIISNDLDNPGDVNDVRTIPINRSDSGNFYCVGMGLGKDPRAITRLEIMEWVSSEKLPNYSSPFEHLGLVRIAFTVKGLNDVVNRLNGSGYVSEEVETIDISPSLSSLFVHTYDPDGNWLTLMEWIKK